jgi:acetamidase/formamidase
VPFVPAATPEQEALRTVPAKRYPGKVHLLPATMETTQWGWFNNAQPPVLRVNSGDSIVFETMMHSHNQVVPGTTIEQIKKLRTDFPGRGPHTLTGPVYIEGAEPGDVLKVRINKIVPRAYGTNFNVPGMFGQFPGKFPEGQVKYFYLDLDRKIAEFAPGIEIPLAPFPGTIGVARAEPGQYSSVPPGRYAGNLDIRDMTEGTALYVPVFVKGALLWTGDSHAAQGNGEINLTALETAYKEMNVTVEVIKNMRRVVHQRCVDHDRSRPGPQQGARNSPERNEQISDRATQSRQGAGCEADVGRVGLPHLAGCRRQQGHPLLQREEYDRRAQDRGFARQGKQDLLRDGGEGHRSQQGHGRRLVGDDRASPK